MGNSTESTGRGLRRAGAEIAWLGAAFVVMVALWEAALVVFHLNNA